MNGFTERLATIENKYRPFCYWGWLENITPEEAVRQVRSMYEAGLGGFVMHARGGLTIPYAGKQWMDSVRAMLKTANELGMIAIVDDEHGWPSGFGAGRVNGMGEEYQLKYLKCETCRADELADKNGTLGVWLKKDHTYCEDASALTPGDTVIRVYKETDPYYVDNMDKKVVEAFIGSGYKDYEDALGKDMDKLLFGIFSDEPQLARYATPWSDTLPTAFTKEYGYSLLPRLYQVFYDTEGCFKLRTDLYKLMQKLFADNYAGLITNWCEERGISLLGHTCLEENLVGQLRCSAGTMPFYKNMSIPGIDWLTRTGASELCVLQMTSVARQTGKERALCEMFGCAGWNISFEELKWIAQKQMLLGVNLQLQHLGLYSLRGSRKREYPASLFFQQPWFDDFKYYNDYFARVSKLLSESELETDVLLIHPMYSVFAKYNGDEHSCDDIQHQIDKLIKDLLLIGVMPDLGDETLMEEIGSVNGNELIIGKRSYKTIIMPPLINISSNTLALLKAFTSGGGRLIAVDRLPDHIDGVAAEIRLECEIITGTRAELIDRLSPMLRPVMADGKENESIYLARLNNKGTEVLYIINDNIKKRVSFNITGMTGCEYMSYDPLTNTLPHFDCGEFTLDRGEALFLVKDESFEAAESIKFRTERMKLEKPDSVNMTENVLTLDFCSVSLDGGRSWTKKEYILDIQSRLIREARNRDVLLRFSFESAIAADVFLLIEDPALNEINVNGEIIPSHSEGWAYDPCFEKIPITIKKGTNVITLRRFFGNSDNVYAVKNSVIHEAEANRVTVETELEAIYILGDFTVDHPGGFTIGPSDTLAATGETDPCDPRFILRSAADTSGLDISDLVSTGLPFFAGAVELKYSVLLKKTPDCAVLSVGRSDTVLLGLDVNGRNQPMMWAPLTAEIKALHEGMNEIKLTLKNSLRNMLGPHYSRSGENIAVGPASYGLVRRGKHFVRFGVSGIELELYYR